MSLPQPKTVSAVIVAGGMGKRLGKEIPKAFVPIGEKELFMYSAEIFDGMQIFNEIIIVVPETAISETEQKTKHFSTKVIVIAGGIERHNSVENGVNSASGEVVLIHDAARPFITKNLVSGLLENYNKSDFSGIISANLVVDTMRKFSENLCGETINRDELISVGTPQIFDKKILLNCFAKLAEDELKIREPRLSRPTDEAMLVQKFGHKVGWVKGSKLNFKVTTPEDIILAEAIVNAEFFQEMSAKVISSEKKTVFLVDDGVLCRKVGKKALEQHYNVVTMDSAKQLFEELKKSIPDLILLDVEMPGLSGYDAIKILKSNEKTSQIPIVFLTAMTGIDNQLEGLALGAADYITKPFTPAILELRVQKHIQLTDQLHTAEQLSMTDKLTNLANRRHFDSCLDTEWRRAARENTQIGVLMLDIDNFKIYNDTHGHQQGDVALQNIAKTLKESVKRPADFVARWGGEEFVILLPNTDKDGTIEVAEKVRQNIERMEIPCLDKKAAKITASVGIGFANVAENRSDTANEFISRADKALYKAKADGRNRICFL